jgi:hypothetical protein
MTWKRTDCRPENKRPVWVVLEHPDKVYPYSYEIHAGTVVYAPENRQLWRIDYGVESDCDRRSWEPDEILAWCYVEDFTEILDILQFNNIKKYGRRTSK